MLEVIHINILYFECTHVMDLKLNTLWFCYLGVSWKFPEFPNDLNSKLKAGQVISSQVRPTLLFK